jgi:hypothetical protein
LATTWVHVAHLLRMPLYISSKSPPPQTVHAESLNIGHFAFMGWLFDANLDDLQSNGD